MRTHVRGLVFGAALAAAVCLLAGAGAGDKEVVPWKQFLPPEAYKELVGRAVKGAEQGLEGKGDEAVRKAQFNALMIAGYTLSAREGGEDLGGVREAALRLIKLAGDKGKEDEARKLLASLKSGAPKGGGKKGLFKPKEHLGDLEDLMIHFRTVKKGGEGLPPALQSNPRLKGALNGIEEKIGFLAKKKLTDAGLAKEAAELALLGYRAAVVAELTVRYPAPREPKVWFEKSMAMRDAGISLAEAAQKKDAEGVHEASNRLNSSCTECHRVFQKKKGG
jgi:hypothetical protein